MYVCARKTNHYRLGENWTPLLGVHENNNTEEKDVLILIGKQN